MRAKVTAPKGLKWSPDGFTERTEPQGAVLDGDLAVMAVEMGKAEVIQKPRKGKKPPENKAGAAPEVKSDGPAPKV